MDFLSPDDDIMGDSKRSITSSDSVKDAFLSDADLETATALSRGPSARQLIPNDSSYDEPRTKKSSTKKTSISSSRKTKKRRKRVIDESKVCEPTPDDVLFGRGGFTNTHPGNIRFRQYALELRSRYELSSKEEKLSISQLLVDGVKSEGRRFLERGSDGEWHEVMGNGARKKASQALRERVKGREKSKSAVSSSITSANSQKSDEDVNAARMNGRN
jgi:hypothetical protein